jgi:subtilisin family serine protease
VAVLDSGVNYLHEDLAANMWDGAPSFPLHGYDFVKGAADPMDRHGHGTHVAGIIGAVGNNSAGVSGVCWSARIMAVRVLDELGAGTTVSIVSGLDFAVTHGAKVVNMSLGGGGTFDPAYSDAFTRAQAAGVLVVVAAGNEANDNDGATAEYPCKFTHPNIVCVAALDQSYALASFSNWGATSVDLGAPGTNILSTWPGSQGVAVETFASGWTGSSTTAGSGGGWGIKNLGGTDYLVDAADYGTFSYNPGTDDRAWKTYNLSAADVATVTFQVAVDLADGDSAQLACKATGGDPFSGGTVLETETGVRTGQTLVAASGDLSSCIGPTMSFGVRLTSLPASAGNFGVAVAPITFKLLAYDTNSYNTIAGTSMASPVVAGVAALLRSYHPAYGYADVASALVAAGRPVASLAGKTTSGKAVDAMASLAYVHPPTGLAAVVH